MTKIEEQLKVNVASIEPFSKGELETAKRDLPQDAEVLIGVAERIAEEFKFLVEAAIIEGVSGNVEQSVLYHKLSFQCLQINGMLMECARGEGANEHYMTARKTNRQLN